MAFFTVTSVKPLDWWWCGLNILWDTFHRRHSSAKQWKENWGPPSERRASGTPWLAKNSSISLTVDSAVVDLHWRSMNQPEGRSTYRR